MASGDRLKKLYEASQKKASSNAGTSSNSKGTDNSAGSRLKALYAEKYGTSGSTKSDTITTSRMTSNAAGSRLRDLYDEKYGTPEFAQQKHVSQATADKARQDFATRMSLLNSMDSKPSTTSTFSKTMQAKNDLMTYKATGIMPASDQNMKLTEDVIKNDEKQTQNGQAMKDAGLTYDDLKFISKDKDYKNEKKQTRKEEILAKLEEKGLTQEDAAKYYSTHRLSQYETTGMTADEIVDQYNDIEDYNPVERLFSKDKRQQSYLKQDMATSGVYDRAVSEQVGQIVNKYGISDEDLKIAYGTTTNEEATKEALNTYNEIAKNDPVNAQKYAESVGLGDDPSTVYLNRKNSMVSQLEKLGISPEAGAEYYEKNVRDKELQDVNTKYAEEHPVQASVATVAGKPFEAAFNVGINAYKYANGQPITNDYILNQSDDIRQSVKDSKNMTGFESFLYDAGMSTADQLPGMLFGSVPLVMGLEKGANVITSGAERGLNPDQIMGLAVADSISTAITEAVPYSDFLKALERGSSSVIRNVLMSTVQGWVDEGLQEPAEDVVDALFDAIIAGDKSELSQTYKNYISQGLSAGEASKKTVFGFLKQCGEDSLAGAISGGLFQGSAGTFGSTLGRYSSDVNAVRENGATGLSALREAGNLWQAQEKDALAREGAHASTVANLVKNGENVVQAAKDTATVEEMINADVDNTDTTEGLTEQEQKFADAIEKNPNIGKALANYEQNYAPKQEKIVNELNEKNEKIARQEQQRKNEQQAKYAKRNGYNAAYEGKNISVDGFSNVSQGNIVLNSSAGELNATEVDTSNNTKLGKFIDLASQLENTEASNNAMKFYKGQNIESYSAAMLLAYRQGQSGLDLESLTDSNDAYVNYLMDQMREYDPSDSAMKLMYYSGFNTRNRLETAKLSPSANPSGQVINLQQDDGLRGIKSIIAKATNLNIGTNYTKTVDNGSFMESMASVMTNASSNDELGALLHETLGEFTLSYNPEGMKNFQKAVLSYVQTQIGARNLAEEISTYQAGYRQIGKNSTNPDLQGEAGKTYEEAVDEYVNDFISGMFMTPEGIRDFTDHIAKSEEFTEEQKTSTINTFADFLQSIIDSITNFIKGHSSHQQGALDAMRMESEKLADLRQQLLKEWDKARAELKRQGIENGTVNAENETEKGTFVTEKGTAERVGEAIATESAQEAKKAAEDYLGGEMYSEKDAQTSKNLSYSLEMDPQLMQAAVKANNKLGNVDVFTMNRAQATRRITQQELLKVKQYLPEDVAGNIVVSNGSYAKSVENSLICVRSLVSNYFMDEVSKKVGRPLSVEEQMVCSQILAQVTGDQTECTYCYVKTDRQTYRAMFNNYYDQYMSVIQDVENNKEAYENDPDYGYKKFLDGRKDTKPMRDRYDHFVKEGLSGSRNLSLEDLTTASVRNEYKNKRSDKAWLVRDAEKYAKGAAWPKSTSRNVKINGQVRNLEYVAYNGNILKWQQSVIDNLNTGFGLRMYSDSDYVPAFLLENMQVVTDAAVRGLKMLSYTKDIGFAKVFAPTGMAINISTTAAWDNKTKTALKDENGNYICEGMMGAEWEDAKQLREENPNVGIVFVAFDDDMVSWALDQDWVDVVIPYHLVRTGEEVAKYYGYKNYKSQQEDRKTSAWTEGNLKSIPPTVHANDKETYLKALQDNNLTPRFEQWIDNPNYMKLVNETRMSYTEMSAVQPNFDLNAAKEEIARIPREGSYGVLKGLNTVEEQQSLLNGYVDEATSAVKEMNTGKVKHSADVNGYIQQEDSNQKYTEIVRKIATPYSNKQLENWKESKNIIIYENEQQFESFVNSAWKGENGGKKLYLGIVTDSVADRIQDETGIDTHNYNVTLNSDNVRKINHSHGDESKEAPRGQRAVTPEDFKLIPQIFDNPDKIYGVTDYKGKPAFNISKNGATLFVVITNGKMDICTQTMFISKNNRNPTPAVDEQASTNTPIATRKTVPNKNIADSEGDINTKTAHFINVKFKNDLQKWYDSENGNLEKLKNGGGFFKLGNTSDALKLIGLNDQIITMGQSKIGTILQTHSYLKIDDIKKVPEVLENPLIIMRSASRPQDSIVLVSDIPAEITDNGKTEHGAIVLSLLVNEKGVSIDDYTVTSYYGKPRYKIQTLLNENPIYYINPDKNKTKASMAALRVQFPSATLGYGLVKKLPPSMLGVKSKHSIDVDPFFEAFEETDAYTQFEESGIENLLQQWSDLNSDVSKGVISKIASNIKKQYNSNIKTAELEKNLTSLFKYLKSSGNISMKDLSVVMKDIATPILENVKQADDTQEKLYKDFISTVKSHKISLNAEQIQEVSHAYGSYYDFKRAMAGKITLDQNGTSLDDIWTELCDQAGGALDYGTVPNNQPVALAQYITSLNPTYYQLKGQTMDEASADLALEIFRQFFEQQSMTDAANNIKNQMKERSTAMKNKYKETLNKAIQQVETEKNLNIKRLANEIDRLTAEEQEAIQNDDLVNKVLIEKMKQDYIDRYEKLKAQQIKKIADAKAYYQNSWINKNLRNERSVLKNRVLKEVTALQNLIAHPQEGATKHVPQKLVKQTIQLLEAINLDNGGRNQAIVERLAKLAEIYDQFKGKEYEFDYDERLAEDIKELQDMFKDRSYADLEITELNRVLEIVNALKTQIKNSNNLILQDRLEDVRKVSQGAIQEVKNSRRIDNAATNLLNRYANAHLNAYREFRKLSGYEDGEMMKLYEDLDEGSRREMQIQRDFGAIFSDVLEGKENQKEIKKFISTKPEDLVEIGLLDENKNPVKVTKAMRMSLIMHSMNAGNMRHVLGSGIVVPDIERFAKGDIQDAYATGKTYRFINYGAFLKALQMNDQAAIESMTKAAKDKIEAMKDNLSPWEKKFLADAETLFHDETGKLINETSLKLKGYTIARVKNYFPIRTDSRFTNADWAGLMRDGSLEGMGMLKERTFSSKPILLEDITNVIQRQTKSVSKYAGLAIPLRNFNMAMNHTGRELNSGELWNLNKVIDDVWHSADTKWLKNLIQDLQNGRNEDHGFSWMTTMRGQFAGATLTLNPSVAIKQAASYPTAAAVVGYKALGRAMADMGKGFIKQQGLEELEKRNPLLWYRNQGNATQELADAKAVGFGKNLPLWMQKAINWTQWMDTGTVRTLEYAAKYYVDDNFELKEGTDAYWNKVSEIFSKVVEETQPNYSTLQKADIIRNPDRFVKMLVMFKTQPMQNFGIVYDALGELNKANVMYKRVKNEQTKADRDAAIQKVSRAISSQVVSAATFSAMTILAQLILHRAYKYRDDDDKWSWLELLSAFGEGMLSTFAGAFLFGTEVEDALKYLLAGETYYGVEVSTVEMVTDLVENIGGLKNYAAKIWTSDTTADRETAIKNTINSGIKLGTTVGEYTGVPVNNIKNILTSMYYYGADVVNAFDNGYFRVSSNYDFIKSWKVKSQYDRIYEAIESGDDAKREKLTQELIDSGVDEAKINSSIASAMKEDYLSGEKTEEESMTFLEDNLGYSEADAYYKVERWETGIDSDYGKLQVAAGNAAENLTDDNRKALYAEVDTLVGYGKKRSYIRDNLKKATKDKYAELLKANRAADLYSTLYQALYRAGYSEDEAKEELKKWTD